MKPCSTCGEEFADKFSFCPVDGTPLAVVTAVKSAIPAENSTFAKSVDENRRPIEAVSAPISVTNDAPVTEQFALGTEPIASMGRGDSGEPEYRLTIIEDAGLVSRLMDQIKLVAHESELTWPEFKRAPLGFTRRLVSGYSAAFGKFLRRPNVAVAITSAVFVVVSVLVAIVLIDRMHLRRTQQQVAKQQVKEELELTEMLPEDQKETPPDEGIGTGKEGRVGFNKGKGEGSEPKFKKASGGGGGGQEEQLPPQQGKLPPPSPIPAAIPTLPPNKPPLLPTAGLDLDPALYKDLPFDRYGDPRSKSKETSAGSGTGNGIGTGTGAGIGEGEGGGFGPGRGGNMGGGDRGLGGGGSGGGTGNNGIDYGKTFGAKDVTQKARILSKPEPQYTEDARKNQITGTVVLKAVLSSSGQVTSIRPVSQLPYGLTEKAIAAARMIKFTPAVKDGHTVSQWIQIEYNFNLY
jgi:TonB family protein